MTRHVAFWIGFFIASIIIVPIAVGAWGVLTEQALNVVAIAFGIMGTLLLLLVCSFFLRAFILKRARLAEGSLEEIVNDTAELVTAYSTGRNPEAKTLSVRLAQAVVGWYAWSNFYRWVVGSCLALLLTFAGFSGTVLLFEQNKRLEQQTNELIEQRKQLQAQNERFDLQNELSSLSLVSELRRRLVSENQDIDRDMWSEYRSKRRFTESIWLKLGTQRGDHSVGECRLDLSENLSLTTLNPSKINAIADLAKNDVIRTRISRALEILLSDQDNSVSVGAALALDVANALEEQTTIEISGFFFPKLTFQTPVNLEIENSYINHLECEMCLVKKLSNSVLSSAFVSAIENVEGSYIDGLETQLQGMNEANSETVTIEELVSVAKSQIIPIYNIDESVISGFFSRNDGFDYAGGDEYGYRIEIPEGLGTLYVNRLFLASLITDENGWHGDITTDYCEIINDLSKENRLLDYVDRPAVYADE